MTRAQQCSILTLPTSKGLKEIIKPRSSWPQSSFTFPLSTHCLLMEPMFGLRAWSADGLPQNQRSDFTWLLEESIETVWRARSELQQCSPLRKRNSHQPAWHGMAVLRLCLVRETADGGDKAWVLKCATGNTKKGENKFEGVEDSTGFFVET